MGLSTLPDMLQVLPLQSNLTKGRNEVLHSAKHFEMLMPIVQACTNKRKQ